MHHLPSLFSFFSLQFQIVSITFTMNNLQCLFSFFFAVPNHFKQCQNAFFRKNVFKRFSAVPIISNTTTVHILEIFFLIFSNTIRMHASETLFLKCYLQFQIVSITVTVHALDIVFKMFSAVPNTIKMHTLETLHLVAIYKVLLI